MIVTCPSCATRHEFANALRAPGNVRITCRACNHHWIELQDEDVIDVEPVSRNSLRVIDHYEARDADEPNEAEVQRLVEAAKLARVAFEARQKARRRTMRNWGIYAAFAVSPFFGLAAFPEAVVSAAPVTAKAYEVVGLDVNIYGLEVRRVQQQHSIVNGVRVLTIKGEIINVTNDVRKLPWLRFGLRDAATKEVYSWTLDTASRPLRPGEVSSFITRVASPPETANDVQIRFAHQAEIGSNAGS